ALALRAAPAAAAPALRLPPVATRVLPNGLTVHVVATSRLPLVDFRLVVPAGSVYDPPDHEGLASLTADLLTQGAGARSARQIAEAIEFVGGSLDADAGEEQLVVTCEVLNKDLATGLELLRDVVVSPTFPDSELARKRAEAVGAIEEGFDDPATVADRALGPALLGTHPLAHPVSGGIASVRRITRSDVVRFHHAHVVPDHALLAIVGDVDTSAVLRYVARAFAPWRRSPEPAGEPYGPPPAATSTHVVIVNKPDVTQTQLRIGCPGVPRDSPDYFPLVVGNTILGGGFTSRLVNEVRVSQGLTYDIGSAFEMERRAGTFEISTFTRNAELRRALDATLATTRRLVQDGPTADELARAKRYLTGQYPLGLQAPDGLAARLLDAEFFGLSADWIARWPERIEAVTLDDVRRALRAHACAAPAVIVVVGDPAKAGPALHGLGPVTVRPVE
ncbi:MAG TPA: pitrilysin family protein, partial [Candidatus Eisenbacteria bacterium]|nr:pitrilysin family protein [Candidatus Eisenbacteria bacterium]